LLHFTGIVAFQNGFLISLFQTGGLYYVEPENGVNEAVIPLGELGLPDGLELVKEEDGSYTLYITEGSNEVSVYKVEAGDPAPTVTLLGLLESEYYDSAATSAVIGDKVYTANLRADSVPFGIPNEDNIELFNETFSVVGVNRFVNAAPDPDDSDNEMPTDDSEDEMSTAVVLTFGANYYLVSTILLAFLL